MNSNFKKRNRSLNKYLGSEKEKKIIIENTLKSNFYSNKEYDNFNSTVSNIAKQLNNISLKSFPHTRTNSNILIECPKSKSNNKKQIPSLKIISNRSFMIKGIKLNNNIINNEKEKEQEKEKNEIKKENENMKENIKFLLGQIKKYQKNGITIEECNKNNFDEDELIKLRNIIKEKEKEIEKLMKEIKYNKKRIVFLEKENISIKVKYNQLKVKYKIDNIDSKNINNTNSKCNSFNDSDENQLYQYNSKKSNYTYYFNYENSKNNENDNYKRKKISNHKINYTTDFSNNYLLRNNSSEIYMKDYSKNYSKEKEKNMNNNYLIKKIDETKKLRNIKYLSLMISSYKDNNNKEIQYLPKTTKGCITNSFLYRKTQIKSDNNKSLTKKIAKNYFTLKDSENNSHKENKKLSSILYHKKNNNFLYNPNNQNINIPTSTCSYSPSKFSYNEEIKTLPKLDSSPNDLYFFPNVNNNADTVYNFKINEMKFSIINYNLMDNSTFKYYYTSSINHSYDILLSISNGFLIITGPNTNYLYFYDKEVNKIYDLCKLNNNHNKGSLIKINNDQIMCISGINTSKVEMYSIKENIWSNLPRMNCPHCESSFFVYNKNIIFSFFGFDYEKNRYIDNIEYIHIKNNQYNEKTWNIINISNNQGYNLRNHSIFYRINKDNNNEKEIYIVGGYNNSGRNNGLIQILINNKDMELNINFKKYEENKVKIKGNNQNLENENIFLFDNEFYEYYDDEGNLFYNYNYDHNFNIHIIDNFTLKHTIYKNKLNN